jgi:hypothetical protein
LCITLATVGTNETILLDALTHLAVNRPPRTFKGFGHNQNNRHFYELWQKSNATDFLLTMNFILFTNQRYPLQNSSLGQLHSDGGVVSIVRSSAERLLLEYLSARRLRSSGYYPKYQNGALSSAL